MLAIVEEEWGEAGGGRDGVVVGELKEGENVVPCGLVCLDKWT